MQLNGAVVLLEERKLQRLMLAGNLLAVCAQSLLEMDGAHPLSDANASALDNWELAYGDVLDRVRAQMGRLGTPSPYPLPVGEGPLERCA